MKFKKKERSPVWNHFTKLSSTKAKCNICNSAYSFKMGVTSNLHKHLRIKHDIKSSTEMPEVINIGKSNHARFEVVMLFIFVIDLALRYIWR